jgi:hypothetical protein
MNQHGKYFFGIKTQNKKMIKKKIEKDEPQCQTP